MKRNVQLDSLPSRICLEKNIRQVSPTTMQTTVPEMKAGTIQARAKQAFHGHPEQTVGGEVTRISQFRQEKTGNPKCNHGKQIDR